MTSASPISAVAMPIAVNTAISSPQKIIAGLLRTTAFTLETQAVTTSIWRSAMSGSENAVKAKVSMANTDPIIDATRKSSMSSLRYACSSRLEGNKGADQHSHARPNQQYHPLNQGAHGGLSQNAPRQAQAKAKDGPAPASRCLLTPYMPTPISGAKCTKPESRLASSAKRPNYQARTEISTLTRNTSRSNTALSPGARRRSRYPSRSQRSGAVQLRPRTRRDHRHLTRRLLAHRTSLA